MDTLDVLDLGPEVRIVIALVLEQNSGNLISHVLGGLDFVVFSIEIVLVYRTSDDRQY